MGLQHLVWSISVPVNMVCVALILLLVIQACAGVTVTRAPSDAAVEVGQNATLSCVVTNRADSENVQWKHRTNSSTTFNAITFNENVLGSTAKYAIAGTYNLTVINAAAADDGTYRCTAGTVEYDAYLTVADLPESVRISWNGTPNAGSTVNLTCTAVNARPQPTLRWLINGIEQTQQALLETTSATGLSTGYVTSVSNLPLALTGSMDGSLAVCYVSYPGWAQAMNATMILDINGSGVLHISTIMMSVGVLLSSLL